MTPSLTHDDQSPSALVVRISPTPHPVKGAFGIWHQAPPNLTLHNFYIRPVHLGRR